MCLPFSYDVFQGQGALASWSELEVCPDGEVALPFPEDLAQSTPKPPSLLAKVKGIHQCSYLGLGPFKGSLKVTNSGPGEMNQWLVMLAAPPEELNFISISRVGRRRTICDPRSR